jgi:hypothetical protein
MTCRGDPHLTGIGSLSQRRRAAKDPCAGGRGFFGTIRIRACRTAWTQHFRLLAFVIATAAGGRHNHETSAANAVDPGRTSSVPVDVPFVCRDARPTTFQGSSTEPAALGRFPPQQTWPLGGTGRRAGFRILCRKASGFESPSGHPRFDEPMKKRLFHFTFLHAPLFALIAAPCAPLSRRRCSAAMPIGHLDGVLDCGGAGIGHPGRGDVDRERLGQFPFPAAAQVLEDFRPRRQAGGKMMRNIRQRRLSRTRPRSGRR